MIGQTLGYTRKKTIVALILSFYCVVVNASENISQSVNCEEIKCGLALRDAKGNAYRPPTLETDVKIFVTGIALRTVVKQRFENPSDEWLEGIYNFPLPVGAAVNELRMKIGEREIIGEIHERAEAQKRYQKAKQSGRKASLIQAHRPNIFTTKVANLGPGEAVVIEIAYFQELPLSIARQQIRFPMVIGPRYIPIANTLDVDSDPPLPNIPTASPAPTNHNPVAIEIFLNLGVPLASLDSLYHEINIEKFDTEYRIRLAKQTTPANRDFVLEFSPAPDDTPRTALLSERNEKYRYGLMMVMPPQTSNETHLDREVTIILDRSGSMSGSSIIQAKAALLATLAQLRPSDRFNIVQFNSRSGQLFNEPRQVSPETLQRARHYVSEINAIGGTEMMGALMRAFSAPGSTEHVQQVFFITDGNVSNEAQLSNYIEQNLQARRLFTIGIGSAPNHYLLQQAAKAGKGFHTAIGDLGEVELRMTALFTKLQKPLLKDISIKADNVELEYWPQSIPDLYAGEPLAIAFRVPADKLAIRAEGKLPDRHWHVDTIFQGGQQRRGLAELWGSRKIASLMADYRRELPDSERRAELRQWVIDTALDSHLVSKFTSLVAVDTTPTNIARKENKSKTIARNLPHGWKLGVAGSLPQTATDANLRIASGLVLILLLTVRYFMRLRQARYHG